MAFRDLQSYLDHLEKHGELRRVKVEVDPELEITEIATRVVHEEGPALLFERVRGADFPLVINIFGSPRRIEMVLGMHPQALGEKLAHLAERMQPPSLGAVLEARPLWPRLLAARVRRVRSAPCHEVVEAPDLNRFPVLKCWPGDGGRFITYPLVLTRDPSTGASNLGIYRMHVHSKDSTGMHMQIQKGGGFHHFRAEKRGEPLELACVLGADPALMLAAVLPLPEGLEEVAFSGLLRAKRTVVTKAKTLSLDVPASAEIVLEGVMPPRERVPEGPFGDHYGHYSGQHPFPVFRIRTVTRRRRPVYPAAVVGKPPQEDRYMGDAAQEMLTPIIRMMRKEIHDMWAYYEAGFHNLLVVAVEGRYTKEPVKTALGLLGEGQLGLTKCVVLVDPSVDVRDFGSVLRAVRTNFAPQDDFILVPRVPLDTLDFTSYKMHLGSKMIIDATGRRTDAGAGTPIKRDPKEIAPAVRRWRLLENTLLAVELGADSREAMLSLVTAPELDGVKIVAAVSPDVNIEDDVDLLWGIFTRFDPARDIVFTRMGLRGISPVYEGVMGIDATFKEGYPEVLVMDDEIRARVDKRWGEYFAKTR